MKNEIWFEALFNYATIGTIVTNDKGEIINFNRKAEADFGYSVEELVQQPIEILLPKALRTRHAGYRNNYYHYPTPRAMGAGRDLFAQRKDGTVFPVEVSLSSYSIDDKLYVIAFVIDITIRKQNENLVQQQKEELEKIAGEIRQLNAGLERKIEDRTRMLQETLTALEESKEELSDALKTEKELGELKSRFVTMASHEFKTPLSTILSSSFLLEKYNHGNEEDKRGKHIERIKNAVSDMKNILNDFLSLDKLEGGLIRANMQIITAAECAAIIEDVISEMQLNLKHNQQIVFSQLEDNTVLVDRNLLKNICSNLLSNATKFSPENCVIDISAVFAKEAFILSVKDQGIGISAEDRQHLFERFFRAANAINIQGTGLGLHIVAKYLDLMNGSIDIASEIDKGTCFTIHIPKLSAV